MSDVNKPIRNIQRALRRLAKADADLYDVVPDGVYGEQTRAAVLKFQGKYGIAATGEIDYETFDKITKEYDSVLETYTEGKTLAVFPSPYFTVKVGDENEIVLVIQAVIKGLSNRFSNINPAAVSGIYDSATAEAIKEIQRVSNISQTGVTDKKTWDALAALYEANVSKNRVIPFDNENDFVIRRDIVLYAPENNDDYRL